MRNRKKYELHEKYKEVLDIEELANFSDCPFIQPVSCPAYINCEQCIVHNLPFDRKKMVEVEIYDSHETILFLPENVIMKMDVRYVCTDFNFSQYDIYEDNINGSFYATVLK